MADFALQLLITCCVSGYLVMMVLDNVAQNLGVWLTHAKLIEDGGIQGRLDGASPCTVSAAVR